MLGLRLVARRTLPTPRVRPVFFIVGVQKAGTTSLFSYLVETAGVVAPLRKEVHFFDLNYARGSAWYEAHFPSTSTAASRCSGEATPNYIFHPKAIERLKTYAPDARVIVCLRDPIERAFSHWRFNVQRGYEKLPFADALAREEARMAGDDPELSSRWTPDWTRQLYSYVGRGRYAQQLKRLFASFAREQVKIVWTEQLAREPATVVRDVLTHIGSSGGAVERPFQRLNVGQVVRSLDTADETRLKAMFAVDVAALRQDFGLLPPWERWSRATRDLTETALTEDASGCTTEGK
jgi:hypothetical protein